MANNPMFNEAAFERAKKELKENAETAVYPYETADTVLRPRYESAPANAMTLQGTINKTFALLFICLAGGWIGWTRLSASYGLLTLFALIALGFGIWTSFKPKVSPFTAPIYAILEGLILGGISAAYNVQYPGIVASAVGITGLVFFIMLFLFKTGIIKVTQGFATAIVSATAAIAILYIGSLLLSFFGVNTDYLTSSSPLSIGISVVVCIVAALNLMLDFQFINVMSSRGDAPKFMEWYAGFGLLVTIVWLYIEILKLLAKSKRR